MVAHRLSTVAEADKIVVLDAGKIAGVGTHNQLQVRCPAYRDLVRAQAGAAGLKGAGDESRVVPAPLHAVSGQAGSAPPRRATAAPAPATGPAALAAKLRAAIHARPAAEGRGLSPAPRPLVARPRGDAGR